MATGEHPLVDAFVAGDHGLGREPLLDPLAHDPGVQPTHPVHRGRHLLHRGHDNAGLAVGHHLGTEPLRQAITGVPQAMASVITSPNGSGHWIGNNNAAAPANSSAFSCCETSSRTSTSSPNSGSTRSAQ
jgi:hypothetical protein